MDTRRRFYLVENDEELRRMLAAPLAAWVGFLHPSQRRLVEQSFRGPVKVTGSAGTGKTVIAMHRARQLARQGRRVLLTSFGARLCENIERYLRLICSEEELARITVSTVHQFALHHILRPAGVLLRPPADGQIRGWLELYRRQTGVAASLTTLDAEWQHVIMPGAIRTWEEYRAASRAGRGTALSVADRERWWQVFALVLDQCERRGIADYPMLCARATAIVLAQQRQVREQAAPLLAECARLDDGHAAWQRADAQLRRQQDQITERAAKLTTVRAGMGVDRTPVRRLFAAIERRAARLAEDEETYRALAADLAARLALHEAEGARLTEERARLDEHLRALTGVFGVDAVIVDEVQDLGPQELRLLAALAADGPDRLMLIGDGGQRIYARRFSLRSLGIDVRGRSHRLRINYRTTEEIRRTADRLSGAEGDDLDGGAEPRRVCRSLLRGPLPAFHGFTSRAEEVAFTVERLRTWIAAGGSAADAAVVARTRRLLDDVRAALTRAAIPSAMLGQGGAPAEAVTLTTMHSAKGLEFKLVIVSGASSDSLPLPLAFQGLESAEDIADAHSRERNLLYVAITRARDEVVVTWSGAASAYVEGVLNP